MKRKIQTVERPTPPIPPRRLEELRKRVEMDAPDALDLSHLHDQLIEAGLEPRHVEHDHARASVILTFGSEYEADAARAACKRVMRSHKPRQMAKTKEELLAVIKTARPGSNEFRAAVVEALERLL
jgi:hypothetical protein